MVVFFIIGHKFEGCVNYEKINKLLSKKKTNLRDFMAAFIQQ